MESKSEALGNATVPAIAETQTAEAIPMKKDKFGTEFYMLCVALSAVSSGVLFTFFTPYAKSLSISILIVGVITFVFGLTRFLMYVLTVNSRVRYFLLRSDRRGQNIVAALVLMSLASLLITIHDPSGLIYLAVYGIVGAGYSIVYAIAQAAMIAEAAPGRVGHSAGLFESSIGVGAAVGPIVAGSISGSSLSFPFIVPSLGLVVFLVALPFVARSRK
jgi:MFS family permease